MPHPHGQDGGPADPGAGRRGLIDDEALDAHNSRIVEAVNASGEVFLSPTKLRGRVALRIAIGNERTTREDVALAWEILRREAAAATPASTAKAWNWRSSPADFAPWS